MLHLSLHVERMLQQDLSRRRQCHAIARAVENICAQQLFEILDPSARRGQRHMHPLGATRQAVLFRYVDEQPEVDEIKMRHHACASSPKRSSQLKSDFVTLKLMQAQRKIKIIRTTTRQAKPSDPSRQSSRVARGGRRL